MLKINYFSVIVFIFFLASSCQKIYIEENRKLLNTIDSLKQIDAFIFNEILLKESRQADDTVLIKEYEDFLLNTENDFWKNLADIRISTIKIRSEKQTLEKKLFGTWEWISTDGGWGMLTTPSTENITRKIVINEDYTIEYFKNGTKIKQDKFYITSTSQYSKPNTYISFIHLIDQNTSNGFQIIGSENNMTLILFQPWFLCADCPSEEFKKVKNR